MIRLEAEANQMLGVASADADASGEVRNAGWCRVGGKAKDKNARLCSQPLANPVAAGCLSGTCSRAAKKLCA